MIELDLGKMLTHEILELDKELHYLKKKYADKEMEFSLKTSRIDHNWTHVELHCNKECLQIYVRNQLT